MVLATDIEHDVMITLPALTDALTSALSGIVLPFKVGIAAMITLGIIGMQWRRMRVA